MLNNIIGGIVISLTNFFVWFKILNKKIDLKNYKLYIGFLFLALTITVNYFVNINLKIISLLLIIVYCILAIRYVFNIGFKDALILSMITQFLYMISESIVIACVSIFLNIQNKSDIIDVFFGTIYANILISSLVALLNFYKWPRNLYIKIMKIIDQEKFIKILLAVLSLITISGLLFYCIYYKNNLTIFIFICTILTVGCFITITKSILVKNNYLNMYVKYNSTLETLKSYEDIMDKYRVSSHENKNQLLMIRNMIIKDAHNDVSKYIDKIVKNDYKDDEGIIMETSKIPAGGLRALIYSKLLYMKSNKIDFDLKIDRKIRSIQFINLDEEIVLDICKIIGVFLDNAIEEVEKSENGSISVEIYMMDDKLNISIANTFEGLIDLDKIDEVKYTTKGDGHGYGLALVKKIICKNVNLQNVRMINDNVFSQVLRISL